MALNDLSVTFPQTAINPGATATFYKGAGGGGSTQTFTGPITGSGTFVYYNNGANGSAVTFNGGMASFTGVLGVWVIGSQCQP